MQCTKRPKDKKTKLSRQGKFDAYVCYDFQGNNDFVTDTFLPALEENHDPPLKLCIHKRDFKPGLQIIDNIRLAIKNSKSAIIIMSQDFVSSEWCTKEFEECCLENIKDPAFTLFVVMMQGRDTLVKVDQYEDFVKKYLHSDTVLDKDDPHLIQKISSLLKRTKTKNPKPKKYRSKSFFQHLKTKSRSVLMRLGKKQTKKNNIDNLVEDSTSEDEHLESPEDLRRFFKSNYRNCGNGSLRRNPRQQCSPSCISEVRN